jgi:protein-disulfide isomerase
MRIVFSGLATALLLATAAYAQTPAPARQVLAPLPQPPAVPADPEAQDYASKLDAFQKADVERRIGIQARNLFNDPGSAVLGNPNGDVTIVEFFDYNCPYSRAVEPRVQALLKSDPNVRLILKEFTIENPTTSLTAGRAAFASMKQGKYQEFHNALIVATGHQLTDAEIFENAQKVGLDVDLLKKDMEDPSMYNQIIKNMTLARAVRAFQTPTFIVNGHVITTPSAQIDFPKLVAEARAAKLK